MGAQVFTYCSGLTSIEVASDNTVFDSRDNSNAIIHTRTNTLIAGCQNTVIPNSVVTIAKGSFAGCTGLTTVDIPEGVKTIEDHVFTGCGLTDVYCLAETVPTAKSNSFYKVENTILHVPSASLETYKATSPWNKFGSIVAFDPSGVKTLESADELSDGKYMKNSKIIIIKDGKKYDAAGRYYE